MTRIAIVGAGGRMGRTLIEAVHQAEGLELAVQGKPRRTFSPGFPG